MMTGEESLRIITEMINKTKVNIRQGSFHLLFWGWLLTFCSLSDWLLAKFTGYEHPYYVWFLVIPGAFVSMIYGFVNGRKEKVHTYANMLYMWTWIGFLISSNCTFYCTVEKYGISHSIYSSAGRIPDISFRIHYQIQTAYYRWNLLLDNGTYCSFCRTIACSSRHTGSNAYWISNSGLYVKKQG